MIRVTSLLRSLQSAACVLLLAACQGSLTAPSGDVLSGTSWELVAIQSPDAAKAHLSIAEPARFTLHFGADGRAALRLDCNRGTGAWQAVASSANAGALTFGPIATTRALCAAPHLDERVARELTQLRSYAISHGRLRLSPTTDGGFLAWQPQRQR